MVIELESCLLSCIGRRGFILQNHDSPISGQAGLKYDGLVVIYMGCGNNRSR